MMDNYGTPRACSSAARAATSGTSTATRYLDFLGGIAVNVARPRPPGARRGGQPPGGHPRAHLQLLRHRARRSSSPSGCSSCRRAGGRPGVLLQLRHRGQRGGVQAGPPDRPDAGIVAAEGALPRPDHGRAGADRQAGLPRAVRAAARRGRASCRTATRPRSGGRRRRRRRARPRADPGRGRCRPAAGRLPRGGPRAHRARTARCWSSTRSRPASAAPARWFAYQPAGVAPDVVTLAKGLGGGLPIGALRRVRPTPPACSRRPARHDLRRQPGRLRGRRSRCSTRSSGTACSTTADGLGERARRRRRSATGPPAGRRRARRAACCSASC